MVTDIIAEDKKNYDEKISILGDSLPINIMCSFTYITPNYDILSSFIELDKFINNKKAKIFIILWDMNIIANPYYKKYCSEENSNTDIFIEKKTKELNKIINTVGLKRDNIVIIRSSDIWAKLINYKNEDLFQKYFSLLARIPIAENTSLRKSSHLFQIVLDYFIGIYFSKLEPDLLEDSIDLIYSDYYKINLYKDVRKLMLDEGYTSKKPLFILMRKVPYIVFEERTPEWNMDKEEIYSIIRNCDLSYDEIQTLCLYYKPAEKFKCGSKELALKLSLILYDFLQQYKSKYNSIPEDSVQTSYSIKRRDDVINLGQLLKSDISLSILLLSDGQRSITDISRQLGKSISTVSQYIKELKAKRFIDINSGGKPLNKYSSFTINLKFLE